MYIYLFNSGHRHHARDSANFLYVDLRGIRILISVAISELMDLHPLKGLVAADWPLYDTKFHVYGSDSISAIDDQDALRDPRYARLKVVQRAQAA